MIEFKIFNQQIQRQFAEMCKTGKLFRANIPGNEIWELYLSSFVNEKIFRDPESSEHNCNCCKNFIRRYGNIIAINSNGNIESIFSNVKNVGDYAKSAAAVDNLIRSKEIVNIFFETYKELNENLSYESCKKNQEVYKLGIEANFKKYTQEEVDKFGVVNITEVYEFNHFCIDLPTQFVNFSGNSIEQITSGYRDRYSVFKRAMKEIPLDTLNLVRDLINQGSLLDGQAHKHSIESIAGWKEIYDIEGSDNWLWGSTYSMDERVAKFKNTLIGVLCTELAEGEELNKACLNWNKRVDPVNYHKASAPITKRQIEDAKKFVDENGYVESFDRRLATIDDIKASEIMHINVGDGQIKSVSIFDSVKATSTRHKRSEFDGVEEITIEKFMKDIIPSCSSLEVYVKNAHEDNFVTMTTTNKEGSKPIFKWNNNYSWTFNGNLAGKSQIKQAIKSRGGKTEGVLNIRLAFPETTNDYDLHVYEPKGDHIYYSNVRDIHRSSGVLDLDAQGVDGHQPPEKRVENIIYTQINQMPEGRYKVDINDYSQGRFPAKFIVEIETMNDITILQLGIKPNVNTVTACNIELKNSSFVVVPSSDMEIISSNTISKDIWGIETNNFHKVRLVCLSPNHWEDNKAGNKHYMFMLDKCKTNTSIRGFHNENLIPELLNHRKVMEVLGGSNMIDPTEKQLSGLGFNSTVKDSLIVKCSGSFKRMLKVNF